ncbi:MAG: PAS domain-containing sensor histidine kinase [Lachnotalea sp.]
MLNDNDRQQLEEIMENNPEFNCLLLKVIEENKFNSCKLSHELRNPITLINSSLQLIESQHPEVKNFKFWNETMDDLQYVRKLLDELTSYNKGNTLIMSEYSISELLNSTCTAMLADINTATRTFTTNYSEELPIITGDSIKIRQVITNLLVNAKEAIDPNNGIVSLKAYCADNDHLQIEVADNGCGIPIEHQESIFDPFVTFKQNGSGLGLSISKKIVEAHNGSIQFVSKLNEGTIFYITLPINPPSKNRLTHD